MDKSELQKQIGILLKALDVRINAIKGAGGYRWREPFKMSDLEYLQFYTETVGKFQLMVVSLTVAEQMMAEQAPSYHARAEEYNRRVREAVEELGKADKK